MAGRNPQAGSDRGPDERAALLSEAHMPWQVAGLLGFDGRSSQHRAHGCKVRGDVVAVSFVELDLISCFR